MEELEKAEKQLKAENTKTEKRKMQKSRQQE